MPLERHIIAPLDQEDTDPGDSATKECPQCHKIFHEEHSLTRHIKLVHDGKVDTIVAKQKLSEDSCSNSSSEVRSGTMCLLKWHIVSFKWHSVSS